MSNELSPILTALSVGGTLAVKTVATQALKDAYAALKSRVKLHYPSIKIADPEEGQLSLEAHPESPQENLESEGIFRDVELAKLAVKVIDFARSEDPLLLRSVGVDLEQLHNASVTFGKVLASEGAIGVRIKEIRSSNLHFGDLEARGHTDSPKKE